MHTYKKKKKKNGELWLAEKEKVLFFLQKTEQYMQPLNNNRTFTDL